MSSPAVSLRVRDRGGGPIIFARWRDGDGGRPEPPLGPGWLVPKGHPDAKPRGKALGGWVDRRGRAPTDVLTIDAAWQAVPDAIAAYERKVAKRAAVSERAGRGSVTLHGGVEKWLTARKTDDPSGRWEAWKHSHAKNMTNYAHRVVRELGPDRPLDEFTTDELRRWLAEGLKPMRNGKTLEQPPSRKLRSTYAGVLSGFFSYALSEQWMESDPAADLPAYRVRKKRAGDVLRREEYLTKVELDRAVAEIRAGDPRVRPGRVRDRSEREQDAVMILLMAMAGLRPGEAIALTWEYVDFKAKVVRIVDSRTMGETGLPKSGSGRFVPISTTVADALHGLRKRHCLVASGDLIFVGRDGAHVDLASLGHRFDAAQERAGIRPYRELRQMRNTFGTICAAEGVPLRTIQHWMGHASITTTEIYASFMPRDEDAALIEVAFA
jgi:integrase